MGALFLFGCPAERPAGTVTPDQTVDSESVRETTTPKDEEAASDDGAAPIEDLNVVEVAAPSDAPDLPETGSDGAVEADVDTGPPTLGCRTKDQDGWLPLPEASGALRFPDGVSLIVSDSGNNGFAVLLAADGTTSATRLPLDGPTNAQTGAHTDDDLEGLALGPDGQVVALTSAGWVRTWTRDGESFTLDRPSYPLSEDETYACASRAVNCGPNYESLCLRPAGATATAVNGCAGYAVSKARAELVCLRWSDGGALTVDAAKHTTLAIELDVISDCAFLPRRGPDDPDVVLLAGNLLSGSQLWLWQEADATLIQTTVTGTANQEALLDRGDGGFWSLGDLQNFSEESPWLSFECGLFPSPAPTSAP